MRFVLFVIIILVSNCLFAEPEDTSRVRFRNQLFFGFTSNKLDNELRRDVPYASDNVSIAFNERLESYVYPVTPGKFYLGINVKMMRDDNSSQSIGGEFQIGSGTPENSFTRFAVGCSRKEDMVLDTGKKCSWNNVFQIGYDNDLHLYTNFENSSIVWAFVSDYHYVGSNEIEMLLGWRNYFPVFYKFRSVNGSNCVSIPGMGKNVKESYYLYNSNRRYYHLLYSGDAFDVSTGYSVYTELFALGSYLDESLYKDRTLSVREYKGIGGTFLYKNFMNKKMSLYSEIDVYKSKTGNDFICFAQIGTSVIF
jgi:hypothetical protein